MSDRQLEAARVARYELAISISANRERVWKALTGQLTSWWLPDFHMLGPDSLVTLEPHAGGRLYEQNGDQELLWYTVLSINPNESLSLVGYCTPEFGGPLTTMLAAHLQDRGESTILMISDGLYGLVTEGQIESLRNGWTELFNTGLKTFVESEGHSVD